MTAADRKLLELAAKAAGKLFDSTVRNPDGLIVVRDGARCQSEQVLWNPLDDDGDALRLAITTGEPFVVRTNCVTTAGGLAENFEPLRRGDDLRAARRAIVRAAAAVGKGMK